ncbi:ABC transporter permease [Nocardioides sp.]|uniref:ABC transporter permease n=1 Tax=Nocardioides sp. TaxID=35761 RepID=UPI0027357607|nr:ABC transporter permease [Nocardioides sp.]MDP3890344.1 ABC transporter permease [Nocardioides sp.]
MIMFFVRRLLTSSLVVLVSTLIMYLLVDIAIDPLEDLRLSTATNKQQLIDSRVALLNLNDPVLVRYLDWLGGVANCFTGSCDLGFAWMTGQPVTSLLGGAVATTLQLVTAATLIAIVLGIFVGIVSALRQYTGFDYSITFMSFLFYSLPTFWVAVLLKQWGAIKFNTFLADPGIPPWFYVLVIALVAITAMGAVGGSLTTRLKVVAAASVSTLAVLLYIDLTGWLTDPSLGIVLVAISAIVWAFIITELSTGLKDRRSLYAALTVAGVGIALYYPMLYVWIYLRETWLIIIGLGLLAILVGLVIGRLWGGPDPWRTARTAALTAIPVSMLLFFERLLLTWETYTNHGLIKGRPIATFSSRTPNLEGSFWLETTDLFTHLILPTLTLVLISFASYTRYTRASTLEVLNQDYIRTARAKGLTERTVVMRHAFRNALIPLASIIPVDIITLLGGAVITETIFSWFGMGRLFVASLGDNMIDPVMAYLLIAAILAVVANFVADLVYSVLDPRIRVNA